MSPYWGAEPPLPNGPGKAEAHLQNNPDIKVLLIQRIAHLPSIISEGATISAPACTWREQSWLKV